LAWDLSNRSHANWSYIQNLVRNVYEMTRVVSIRLPELLSRTIRLHASRSETSTSDLIGWLLGHLLADRPIITELSDVTDHSDSKIDIRLSHDAISRLLLLSRQRRLALSVYIRAILYAYYTKRLVFIHTGSRYTLVANHDKT